MAVKEKPCAACGQMFSYQRSSAKYCEQCQNARRLEYNRHRYRAKREEIKAKKRKYYAARRAKKELAK